MPKSSNAAYDAIIIGAGIGGLACGCYLAKAGMKVLIAEQHHKPGGYCTSFKRDGFTFSAAAHFLGGFKYGNLGNILKELNILDKMKVTRFDPSNTIITPNYNVSFWEDHTRTIREFQAAFPDEEENIQRFFLSIIEPNPRSSMSMRTWSFKDLLDTFFRDARLKTILCFPLFGNAALPPSLVSAFVGTKIFREFLLDGGYYPEGGIQMLSDAFAARFGDFGGDLKVSCLVDKIRVYEGRVAGIVSKETGFISARYVVSDCDARQTFLKLLGKNVVKQDFVAKINAMVPSLSGFVLYLGFNKSLEDVPHAGTNLWILKEDDLDIESAYTSVRDGNYDNIKGYLLYVSPDRKSALAFLVAPFKDRRYWMQAKSRLRDELIARIEKDAIIGLSAHLKYKDAATPHTLHRYTLNYKGAAFGWACTPSQLAISDFRKPSFVQGLYLTGHWATKGFGIPGVVYVGHDTAKMILRKEKMSDVAIL